MGRLSQGTPRWHSWGTSLLGHAVLLGVANLGGMLWGLWMRWRAGGASWTDVGAFRRAEGTRVAQDRQWARGVGGAEVFWGRRTA